MPEVEDHDAAFRFIDAIIDYIRFERQLPYGRVERRTFVTVGKGSKSICFLDQLSAEALGDFRIAFSNELENFGELSQRAF